MKNVDDIAAILHLREVCQGLIEKHPCDVGGECHCETCVAEHAMACTSGYADEEE